MKMFKTLGLTLAVAGLLGGTARANQIEGTIAFGSSVYFDSTIPFATKIVGWGIQTDTTPHDSIPGPYTYSNTVFVTPTTQSGDYLGTDSSTVIMQPFQFLPSLSPDPVAPLWAFSLGSVTYSFNMVGGISVSKGTQTINNKLVNTLDLFGTGIASITGYDDTPGTWALTTQGNKASLSFSAVTDVSPVPDGGFTAILIGSGLLALAMIRRKNS